MFDSLDLTTNNSAESPRLLYHTKFDGISLNVAATYAADAINPSRNFYTPFAVTVDSSTEHDIVTSLKSIFGSNSTVVLQSIPQNQIQLSDFQTYHSPNIASNGEITLTCNMRDTPTSPNPQEHLFLLRTSAQALASDIEELCIVTDIKLPAHLNLSSNVISTTGYYYIVEEYKTGSYNNQTSAGDMRFKVEILGNNGFNEWVLVVDDGANGYGIVPGLPGPSTTIYSRKFSGISAQLGVYTKVYLYWNRPKCILKLAIHPDGGDFRFVAEITAADMLASALNKSTLYGIAELPITRFFFVSNYSSANNLPVPTVCSEFQIWNKLPIII